MGLLQRILAAAKEKGGGPPPEPVAFASWGGRGSDSEWSGSYRQADHVAAPPTRQAEPAVGYEGGLPPVHPFPVAQLDVVSHEQRGDLGLPALETLGPLPDLVQEFDHQDLLLAYADRHVVKGPQPAGVQLRPLV